MDWLPFCRIQVSPEWLVDIFHPSANILMGTTSDFEGGMDIEAYAYLPGFGD